MERNEGSFHESQLGRSYFHHYEKRVNQKSQFRYLPDNSRTTFPLFMILPMMASERSGGLVSVQYLDISPTFPSDFPAQKRTLAQDRLLVALLRLDLTQVELQLLALQTTKIK